jgi:MarR family transcriptional regulator, organic hydroperoxide resistance regulator
MLIADWQRVTHRLLGALDDELAALGLSAGEVNLLACLAEAEPQTARALGEATGQRPSTLTGVLDRLERRALVERRPNPTDRRSTLIGLSAAGRDAAGEVTAAFKRVAGRLPPETAAEVQRLLDAVERSL